MANKKLAIIASKGTLEWAYQPLILASTAAALGYEARIFFTFYGLEILKKNLNLQVSSLGNPAMPLPGNMPMPVILQAMPGMQALITGMMKRKMHANGVVDLEELRKLCVEAEVKMIACQMSMDLFGIKRRDLLDRCECGGAATFFEFAGASDMSLFV
ncbi:MAG TPA: peroxiredoxin family protein [Gammaproteobacteria bacterium]|nr:peroxiredoxin family protein [Gammaproteobacteria bacterium]